jgi:phosphatidylglycerol---prolipoprotein diacylglyceryl transferase
MAIAFPNIDPVAFSLGPISVHWYALAYLAGFLGGWVLARYFVGLDLKRNSAYRPNKDDIDDFISWAILAILVGGRLGYVLFYNLPVYINEPLEALKLWRGGMAWHGGLIGVIIVTIIYAWRKKIPLFRLSDLFAVCAPIGFFFGRIANFINGELYGRVTDVAWAVEFPRANFEPRHPSQLYQAGLEGLVLFLVLLGAMHIRSVRERAGTVSALFLGLYAVFRFAIEFFREPDAQLGFIAFHLSMGQILCIPMMMGAFIVFYLSRRGLKQGG